MKTLPKRLVDPSTTHDQNSLEVKVVVTKSHERRGVWARNWTKATILKIRMKVQLLKNRVKTLKSLGPTIRQLMKLKNCKNTNVWKMIV